MNASNESSIVVSNDTTPHRDILQISSATINLLLGVPANGWVLWLVFTGPAGTTASDFFTLNLSVCEIVFSLLYLPATLVVKPDIRLLLSLFISGLLLTGRPLFQTCIVVERFLAVVHPVLYLRSKPLRYRAACSAAAWLLTVGFSLLYMLAGFTGTLRYVHVGKCLFFMSVMLWCSLAVLRALRRPVPGETAAAAGRERERESRDGVMKRRAFTVICLIMGSFLGSFLVWTVFAILAEQEGLLLEQEFTLVIGICMLLSVVTGFVQPLLYLCHKTGKLPCGVKPVQDP